MTDTDNVQDDYLRYHLRRIKLLVQAAYDSDTETRGESFAIAIGLINHVLSEVNIGWEQG